MITMLSFVLALPALLPGGGAPPSSGLAARGTRFSAGVSGFAPDSSR